LSDSVLLSKIFENKSAIPTLDAAYGSNLKCLSNNFDFNFPVTKYDNVDELEPINSKNFLAFRYSLTLSISSL
jgi:hypothetical protein